MAACVMVLQCWNPAVHTHRPAACTPCKDSAQGSALTLVHFLTRSWLACAALTRGVPSGPPAPAPALPPPPALSVSFFQKKLLKK